MMKNKKGFPQINGNPKSKCKEQNEQKMSRDIRLVQEF
jgi:hypothetical protein